MVPVLIIEISDSENHVLGRRVAGIVFRVQPVVVIAHVQKKIAEHVLLNRAVRIDSVIIKLHRIVLGAGRRRFNPIKAAVCRFDFLHDAADSLRIRAVLGRFRLQHRAVGIGVSFID